MLLADFFDKSGMHNYLALSGAKNLENLKFTVTPNPVVVYLNGECRGLYILTEQIQEDEGRLNLVQKVPSSWESLDEVNFYFGIDYHSQDELLKIEGRDYFTYGGQHNTFNLEYPDYANFMTNGISEDVFYRFFKETETYMKNMHDIFMTKNSNDIDFLC